MEEEKRENDKERGGKGGQEGPAAPQPTSTLGLVKVSEAGPTLFSPPTFLFLPSSRFFLRDFFFKLRLASRPPQDAARTALSRHTMLGPTPSSVLLHLFSLVPSPLGNPRNPN